MISAHTPQSVDVRWVGVAAQPGLQGAVWRLSVHIPRPGEEPGGEQEKAQHRHRNIHLRARITQYPVVVLKGKGKGMDLPTTFISKCVRVTSLDAQV